MWSCSYVTDLNTSSAPTHKKKQDKFLTIIIIIVEIDSVDILNWATIKCLAINSKSVFEKDFISEMSNSHNLKKPVNWTMPKSFWV